MRLPAETLARIRGAYDEGRFLQGYNLGIAHAPLREWEGLEAGLLAGRLACHLGGNRLGVTLFMLQGRRHPDDLEAQCYRARALLEWRGPLAAWELLRDRAALADPDPVVRAHWHTLHAQVLAVLRDFEAAEEQLARAFAETPDDPWPLVCRAYLREREDRHDDALAAARDALAMRPWYPPAVGETADLLIQIGRIDEAHTLLSEAAGRIESNLVAAQLITLEIEMERYQAASASLDRLVRLSPIMEKSLAHWIAAQRSDLAFHRGDRAAAREFATRAGHPFWSALAERLGGDPAGERRVLLRVPFVRQHESTCCPATLAALGRFWSKPTDHLGVAEEICYDGTPAHSERLWAERNGWRAHEFTVTWEAATALLDRSIPFALGTVNAHRGHMQAVIGYNTLRGTLMLRDPSVPVLREAWAEDLLRDQRATGPRGLALVPEGRDDPAAHLDLPESALYDRMHALQAALFAHDRARARGLYDVMAAEAPDHRLTLLARRSLAAYDGDPETLLACHARLRAMFPGNVWLETGHLEAMRPLARREERLATLESLCEGDTPHPIYWTMLAIELAEDAREHPRAVRMLRRAVHCGYLDGRTLGALASVSWAQGRREYALALYRFAACLDDKDESLAVAYFRAAHHLHRAGEGLSFLEGRMRRLGRLSGRPTRTFFEALCVMGRTSDAFAMLDEALAARPGDADLMLFAADVHARHGNVNRAGRLLAAATGHAKPAACLRAAAALAAYRGDPHAALSLWRQVLGVEPLAMDAHAAVARRLDEIEGHAAAVAHLRDAARRFPCCLPLHQLLYERQRDRNRAGADEVLRGIVAVHPVNAWARREIALRLGEQRRFTEAFAQLSIAGTLEPRHPAERNVYGTLCQWAGRPDEAKEAWREAIRMDVDNAHAIGCLVTACSDAEERAAALALVRDELGRQVTDGTGLSAYVETSRGTRTTEERLADMRRLLRDRPGFPPAASAVVGLLLESSHPEEALALAVEQTERHPLVPLAWVDLAVVRKALRDDEGGVAALERAVAIDPGGQVAVSRLSLAHARLGRPDRARAILEAAAARDPLEPVYRAMLGHLLWTGGDREGALTAYERAVRLNPEDTEGWDYLASRALEAGHPGRPADIARDLTSTRAGEAACWIALARTLTEPGDLTERLAALDEAIRLEPHRIEAHDLKAVILAESGRFDEARAACRPPQCGDPPPMPLRGRNAWVEAAAGHLDAAIDGIRTLVQEDPSYRWGWEQLADWCLRSGRNLELLGAAERMTELAPLNPSSHGYLGYAKRATGDTVAARAAWARALELAPDYVQVARGLFDLEMDEWDLRDAEGTLEHHLRPHIAPEEARILELRLAASPPRRTLDQAVAALRALCLSPGADDACLDAAASIMAGAGWGRALSETVTSALREKDVNPHVGAVSIRLSAATRRWRHCESCLDSLDPESEAAVWAAAAYVSALAGAGERALLRKQVTLRGPLMRRLAVVWAGVGGKLLEAGLPEDAAGWLLDRPQHGDVRPAMLLPLVESLQRLDRRAEALRAIKAALAMPGDDSTPYHRVWGALLLALEGDSGEAGRLMESIPVRTLPPYYDFLREMTRALLRVQDAPPASRRAAFAGARLELRHARARRHDYRNHPDLRRALASVASRMATLTGGFLPRLWGAWRRVDF